MLARKRQSAEYACGGFGSLGTFLQRALFTHAVDSWRDATGVAGSLDVGTHRGRAHWEADGRQAVVST